MTLITKHNYSDPVPAGPSAHVVTTANGDSRFPRLAMSHGHGRALKTREITESEKNGI